jgi:hypothetical protein
MQGLLGRFEAFCRFPLLSIEKEGQMRDFYQPAWSTLLDGGAIDQGGIKLRSESVDDGLSPAIAREMIRAPFIGIGYPEGTLSHSMSTEILALWSAMREMRKGIGY